VLAKAPRIVCKHGVGVDNIDLNAVDDFGLTFNANKQILALRFRQSVKRKQATGLMIYGKTLGIVGLSQEVARRARGFNMLPPRLARQRICTTPD
jgi:D-3-phosphoglycerate dehydrogenase